MSENIHQAIKNEYEKRQKAAFDDLVRRRNEVYSRLPAIEALEREMQLTAVRYNKMILIGLDSMNKTLSELSARIDRLKREKEELLANAGYDKNYLEITYQCPRCSDTGFVDTGAEVEKCACYRQQVLNYLFSRSNIKVAEKENFSMFDESYYPSIPDEARFGIKISPRENILYIKEHCIAFIENFASPDVKNLYFCGPTGVGKTFMANCIAMELMKRGITVLYQTAPVLFSTIHEYRTRSFKGDGESDESYRNILEAELLIIDDLGTEAPSAARYAELLTILNTRQSNNMSKPCKTIISTNIEVKMLHEYYDERIVSRIIGCFDMFKFAGEDIRVLKRLKG